MLLSNIELNNVQKVKNEDREITKIKAKNNASFWKQYFSIKLTKEQKDLLERNKK